MSPWELLPQPESPLLQKCLSAKVLLSLLLLGLAVCHVQSTFRKPLAANLFGVRFDLVVLHQPQTMANQHKSASISRIIGSKGYQHAAKPEDLRSRGSIV